MISIRVSEFGKKKYSLPIDSYLNYYANKYSEAGQDGIIAEILSRLGIRSGTFVEFGAWDGIYASNCRKLIEEGFTGIFIEGNQERFLDLLANYPSKEIIKINAFVGYSRENQENLPLDKLLLQFVDQGFIDNLDLLVIDVDGLDLEVALNARVKPKIIVMEGGSSFVPIINSPFHNARENYQHPLAYIVSEMNKLGYVEVCFHQDLYLIRNDLWDPVLIGNVKTVEQLFTESFFVFSKKSRRDQMLRRKMSLEVREFESLNLQEFNPNPIRFLEKQKIDLAHL